MALLMVAVTLIPSTFSWYSHSESATGNLMKYTREELPVSMKTASDSVTMETKLADKNAEEGNTVSSISVPAGQIKYYVTTLTNSGNVDTYLDLQLSSLPNNADVKIGTNSPVINQKAYASRAARTKKTYDKVRVYFKTHSSMNAYWSQNNCKAKSKSLDLTNEGNSSNETTSDMNIAFKRAGAADETKDQLERCPNTDSTTYGGTTRVFYYDLPSDTEYFYFFNHWYMTSGSNREWNRTIDITDLSAGYLYYLNGERVDEKYKAYSRVFDDTLLNVMSYYDTARLSTGSNVTADIGLKKDPDNADDEFTPDYYGNNITYSSSNTNVCTVNRDGLITPKTSGTATITTTITGKFGDTTSANPITTSVSIPSNISQFPIASNILVPHDGSTDSDGNPNNVVKIHWYIINNGSSTAEASSIFVTI